MNTPVSQQVKERPFNMLAHEVSAVLAGRQTMVRRAMKPQPSAGFLARGLVAAVPQWPMQDGVRFFMADNMSELVRCPLGRPGETLWIRETFAVMDKEAFRLKRPAPYGLRYKADPDTATILRFRPSIFMPRWASRITLEIESVRVERLQAISEEDAKAEGIIKLPPIDASRENEHVFWRDYRLSGDGTFCVSSPIASYRSLWESINGPDSWAANPWVWVISFLPASPQEGAKKGG